MPRKIAWIAFWMTVVFWLGGLWGCAAPGDDQNYKVLEEDEPLYQADPPGLHSRESIAETLDVALDVDAGGGAAAPAHVHGPAVVISDVHGVDDGAEPVVTAPTGGEAAAGPAPIGGDDEAATADTVTVDDGAAAVIVGAGDVAVATPDAAADAVEVAADTTGTTPAIVVTDGDGAVVHVDPAAPIAATMAPVIETGPSLQGLDRSQWPRIAVGPSDGATRHNPIYFRDCRPRTWCSVCRRECTAEEMAVDEAQRAEGIDVGTVRILDGAESGNLTDGTNAAGLVIDPVKFGVDLILLPFNMIRRPPLSVATSPPFDDTD